MPSKAPFRDTLFSATQGSGNLQYHREQSELRLVGSTVSTALRVWLASDSNNINILRSVVSTLKSGNTCDHEKLPNYIKGLINNPRTTLPALNQEITDETLRLKVIATIERVISDHDAAQAEVLTMTNNGMPSPKHF